MNPDFNPSTNLNLPQPVQEGQFEAAPGVETVAQSAEGVPAATPNQQFGSQPTIPAFMTATGAANQQAAAAPENPMGAMTPAVADDGDRIEKEWVLKAKQIVGSTVDDPFQQNRQMAHMKADYLQKRYGKVVKLTE
jgi:hypothetical protein